MHLAAGPYNSQLPASAFPLALVYSGCCRQVDWLVYTVSTWSVSGANPQPVWYLVAHGALN